MKPSLRAATPKAGITPTMRQDERPEDARFPGRLVGTRQRAEQQAVLGDEVDAADAEGEPGDEREEGDPDVVDEDEGGQAGRGDAEVGAVATRALHGVTSKRRE